ncbi:MAG: cytochrome P450, partial [Verrucomicrobiota bacterium]|nr:cytochrome P450 [Verrucomicrobiota bacterium]
MTNSYQNLELCHPPRFYRQWEVIKNPSNFINNLISQYGDFIHYRGLIDFYLINNAELIKKVLNETHRNFDKNTIIYNRFRNAFGNGLVTAEGDHWRRQRKLIQPAFKPLSIKSFFDIMVKSSMQMIERWRSEYVSLTSFNLTEEINKLTLDIAGKSLLSNGFNKAAKRIIGWTHSINKYSAGIPLPFISHPSFPSPLNLKLNRALKEYKSFIFETIKERRNSSPKDDLLSVFLNMRDEETGEKMKDDEIAEEVLGIIVGGHETSATALVWTIFELCSNSAVNEKLLLEIDKVTGKGKIDFNKIGEFKYMKMVIQESMRLHPPFWFENRNALSDVELGGVSIPKGSMSAFSRYALHRNKRDWDSPEEFIPDRFDLDEDDEKINMSAYLPFSSGPRICIGRHFAMMEMTVILCLILKNYKISICPNYKHNVAINLT